MNSTISSFTKLHVWQKAHILVLAVYSETKSFPKEEVFGLTSQMRRCAVSVTSNIAEGFGRRNEKEKVRFYNISEGSVRELQNQLLIARDLKMMPRERFQKYASDTMDIQRMLSGLIRKIGKDMKERS